MNKWLKYGLIAAAALVLLVIVGAVIFVSTFDPNAHKAQITEAVKKATGRDLVVSGQIKVSVFPWLGAEVGGVSLSNAKGFGDKPMVQIGSAQVRLKLLPLLTGSLELGRVTLENLNLNLAQNKDGVTNWDDLAGKQEGTKEAAPAAAKPSGGGGMELAVGGLNVKNANIVWDDAKANRHDAVRNVNVTIGAIAPGKPFDFDVNFGLESKSPEASLQNAVKGTASLDLEAGRYTVKGLDLKVLATGKAVPGGKADVGVTVAQAAVDTKAQTAALDGGVLRLDSEKLNFNAKVSNFAAPAVVFALTSDFLDLDKILPKQAAGTETKAASTSGPAGPEPDVIPVDVIRKLNLDGTAKIAKLKVHNLTLTNLDVKILAKNGLLTVDPNNLALYGGTLTAPVTVDCRGEQPLSAARLNLQKVQLGPLLKDLTGKDSYGGGMYLTADLKTSGAKVSAMKRGLNGPMALKVLDGVFPGVDLEALVTTVAKSGSKSGTVEGKAADRTNFGEITATAQATNGIISNKDLLIKSPNLRAEGEGLVNLPADSIDYLVRAKLMASGTGNDSLLGLLVPVRVKGSLSNPSYSVDLAEYFKGAATGLVKGVGGAVEGVGSAIGGVFGGQKKETQQSGTTSTKSGSTDTKTDQKKKGGVLEGIKSIF